MKVTTLEKISEKDESSLLENAIFIETKNVSYSLAGCRSFEEARELRTSKIIDISPEEALYFIERESNPSRPAGMSGVGPIIFTSIVDFYR